MKLMNLKIKLNLFKKKSQARMNTFFILSNKLKLKPTNKCKLLKKKQIFIIEIGKMRLTFFLKKKYVYQKFKKPILNDFVANCKLK